MANQLNFSSIITGVFQRPDRIDETDLQLIENQPKQIIFGTNPNDNVEVWMYNPDSSFAGHLRLGPTDPALVISTLVDNNGAVEVLNVDMRLVGQRLALEAGRYGLALNFFRDEVGSELGPKFYVANISADRTEVLLKPIDITDDVAKQVFEFIEPSVPKLFAKALVDQIFGKALSAPSNQTLTIDMLNGVLESLQPGILDALVTANVIGSYSQTVSTVLSRTYTATLDAMAADNKNYNIQRIELENYIFSSLATVIAAMNSAGEIDPRLKVS